jgi:hypothetical protein
MSIHFDIGRDDSQDDYVIHIPGDINQRLAGKCISAGSASSRRAAGSDMALWYVSRRHILEILPEGILSGLAILAAGLTLPLALAPLMAAIILIAVAFFLFEIWRWDNEIIYVSQSAIVHRFWNWRKFSWDKAEYYFGNIADIKAVRPIEFSMSGISAGSVTITTNSGQQAELPLTPSPYLLLRRKEQAQRHRLSGFDFQGSSPWLEPTAEHFRD